MLVRIRLWSVLSPLAKVGIIILYLAVGILFYHVGDVIHKGCTESTLLTRCGDGSLALLADNSTYAECVLSCTESWSIIDALYFSMVTMSTVGYGDLTPGDSWEARLFTCFFIIVGIAGPFLIISIELGGLLNRMEAKFRSIVLRGDSTVAVDLDGDGDIDFEEPPNVVRYYAGGFSFWIFIIMSINLVSAAIYVAIDSELDYGTALYHCWVTATTVGYGDVSMRTQGARAWSCIHIAVAVGTLGAFIGKAQELRDERKKQVQRVELLKKKLDKDLICSLDQEGNGVDKTEFVVGMLVKLEMVKWADVEPFIAQFEMLDVDGSGRLTEHDLAAMVDKLATKVNVKPPSKASFSSTGLGRMTTTMVSTRGSKTPQPTPQPTPQRTPHRTPQRTPQPTPQKRWGPMSGGSVPGSDQSPMPRVCGPRDSPAITPNGTKERVRLAAGSACSASASRASPHIPAQSNGLVDLSSTNRSQIPSVLSPEARHSQGKGAQLAPRLPPIHAAGASRPGAPPPLPTFSFQPQLSATAGGRQAQSPYLYRARPTS